MNINLTLIEQAISFAIFVWFCMKYVWPPITSALEKRKKSIAYSYWKDGISLRTDKYRLTRFFRHEEPKIELYNHLYDSSENENIAHLNQEVVDSLMPTLMKSIPKFYEFN